MDRTEKGQPRHAGLRALCRTCGPEKHETTRSRQLLQCEGRATHPDAPRMLVLLLLITPRVLDTEPLFRVVGRFVPNHDAVLLLQTFCLATFFRLPAPSGHHLVSAPVLAGSHGLPHEAPGR